MSAPARGRQLRQVRQVRQLAGHDAAASRGSVPGSEPTPVAAPGAGAPGGTGATSVVDPVGVGQPRVERLRPPRRPAPAPTEQLPAGRAAGRTARRTPGRRSRRGRRRAGRRRRRPRRRAPRAPAERHSGHGSQELTSTQPVRMWSPERLAGRADRDDLGVRGGVEVAGDPVDPLADRPRRRGPRRRRRGRRRRRRCVSPCRDGLEPARSASLTARSRAVGCHGWHGP